MDRMYHSQSTSICWRSSKRMQAEGKYMALDQSTQVRVDPDASIQNSFLPSNLNRIATGKIILNGPSWCEIDCSRKVLESSALKMRRILVSLLKRKQKRFIYCSQVWANPLSRVLTATSARDVWLLWHTKTKFTSEDTRMGLLLKSTVGHLFGPNCSWDSTHNPPIPLNSLFSEDSTYSDEDLAEELVEFFRFMIWDDLSGEEEETSQVLLKMKSWKALFLLRTSLLNFMILMTLMMTDLPQASDNRVRFSPSAQEAVDASRIRRRCITYITEILYTVLNKSSVHSICDRPNPRRHVNCIH